MSTCHDLRWESAEDTKVGNRFHGAYLLVCEVRSVRLGHNFASLPSYSVPLSGIEYDSCLEKAVWSVVCLEALGRLWGKRQDQKPLEGWVISNWDRVGHVDW